MPTPKPQDARAIAAAWRGRLSQGAASTPRQERAPASEEVLAAALAELVAACLLAQQTVLLVVPDDELLPSLSNALDLALRPLCLVLPQPGFASRIALRATLSLLKSRLARGGDVACPEIWEAQRSLLERHSESWQAALAWCGSSDARVPQVGMLFPACLLPLAQAEAGWGEQRDVLVVVWPERMGASLAPLLAQGRDCLLLSEREEGFGSASVPALSDADARLAAEREVLTQQISELELELATVQAELADFTRRYSRLVGSRLAELDRIEASIARLLAETAPQDSPARNEAAEAQARADRSADEHSRFARFDAIEKPFAPSADLKRLFRQLAQKIHPDRATDETERAWRTELMSEANRAYRNSDAMALDGILAQWREGAPSGRQANATGRDLLRLQRRLAEVERELDTLLASRLYELFIAAKLAGRSGRDLLAEMADKLDAQVRAAEERRVQLESA